MGTDLGAGRAAGEAAGEEVPDLAEVEPGHFVACHFQTKDTHLTRGKVADATPQDKEVGSDA